MRFLFLGLRKVKHNAQFVLSRLAGGAAAVAVVVVVVVVVALGAIPMWARLCTEPSTANEPDGWVAN